MAPGTGLKAASLLSCGPATPSLLRGSGSPRGALPGWVAVSPAGGALRLMLVGLEQQPDLPCLEKEKLPAVLAATAWEIRDQGGDDSQRIFPGGRSAMH